jgi:hypothetical protein
MLRAAVIASLLGLLVGTAPRGGAAEFVSEIVRIEKTHNLPSEILPRRTADAHEPVLDRPPLDAPRSLSMRMDVHFVVRGEMGRDVFVAVWFMDRRNGAMIRSNLPAYADSGGLLTAQTHAARVGHDPAAYVATVLVPYAAFPRDPHDDTYGVEARVVLMRPPGPGCDAAELARSSTTFVVHGCRHGTRAAAAAAAVTADVAVPNVVGTTWESSEGTLRELGLEAEVRVVRVPLPVHDALVMRQTPRAGERAAIGTRVLLEIGRYVAPTRPSQEVGDDEDAGDGDPDDLSRDLDDREDRDARGDDDDDADEEEAPSVPE